MLFTSPFQSRNSNANRARKSKGRRRPVHRNSAQRTSFSPRLESLENRALLTTLAVDIGDVSCGDAGDNLYCEIQEAIDVAEAGDSIQVHEGTYEPISIDKNDLRIHSVGSGAVVIDVNAAIDNTLPPEPGVELNADGVTIRGLTVTDARGYGMLVTGDHNTLQQNLVEHTSAAPGRIAHGFGLIDANHNILTGNSSLDNDRMGFDLSQSDSNTLHNNFAGNNDTNGFNLGSGADSNTLSQNQAIGGNNGYVLADNEGNTLRGNLAESNNFRGYFLLFFTQHNTLQANTARDNGRDGFNLFLGASSNTLVGNLAEGNGTAGGVNQNFGFVLSADSNNNLLQGNTATGNDGEGFLLATTSFNTLQGNIAKGNGKAGFSLTGNSASNTFKANTALGNSGNGFSIVGNEDPEGDEYIITSNVFQNNSAVKNDEYGFFVDELFADDNEFKNNHCVLNGLGDSNIADIC